MIILVVALAAYAWVGIFWANNKDQADKETSEQ